MMIFMLISRSMIVASIDPRYFGMFSTISEIYYKKTLYKLQ